MKKLINKIAAESFGYVIIGHGFKKRHYCFSYKEALSWAGCYKAANIYRKGAWIAEHKHK